MSHPGEPILEPSALRGRYRDFRRGWLTLSFYERFEQIVALILASLIAVIIAIAVWDLTREVVLLAVHDMLDPLDHRIFQAIFGQIMTVLIALEFKHSIIKVVAAGQSIIQVKTVLLIAVLALARKFIVLHTNEYSAATLFALAAVMLALGVTYWLIRDRETRTRG